MKWNLWLSVVAGAAVFFATALPLYLNARNPEWMKTHTAPPGAAFLLAVPYAVGTAIATFVVCWFLQKFLKL
jgi:hypothetical protein